MGDRADVAVLARHPHVGLAGTVAARHADQQASLARGAAGEVVGGDFTGHAVAGMNSSPIQGVAGTFAVRAPSRIRTEHQFGEKRQEGRVARG